MTPITTQTLENALTAKLMVSFGKTAAEATDGEMMRASALVLRDMMALREVETRQKARQRHARHNAKLWENAFLYMSFGYSFFA